MSRVPPMVLTVCSLLCFAGAACRESPKPAQAADAPIPPDEVRIDTASGKLAYIRVEVPSVRREREIAALPAQVAMDEDRTVRVLTPVAGRVAVLDAAPGDEVGRGAPLAHIVSPDLAQAASDFAKARASAAQARTAAARAQDLYAHHVAALKDVEQARSDDQQAEAELARARSRLTTLGADTSGFSAQYVLRAPLAGVVVERTVNPGAEVRPDAPAPLFTITSLDVVWLTANVYQRDLAAIHRGVTLRFTTDVAPGRTFDATVTYISGALDPQTRTALVRASMPNADHALRPLEVGTAHVLAPSASPLLTIPTRALVTHGSNIVVYVQTAPGRFVRRTVTVGDDDGTNAVILSGIGPTDQIVVDGSLLLEGEASRES
jgi:cobalt-zinc-cadmium efflux system membrane fusion protein